MFNIVLFEPEIPPNTGNVIRLCANTGCQLHLIEPLGFRLTDRELKRAGLDYHDLTYVKVHRDLPTCLSGFDSKPAIWALSTRGTRSVYDAKFSAGDVLLFGPETRGLPADLLNSFPAEQRLRLPMVPGNRSLNLSNAVAVVVYEAWRQNRFTMGVS